MSSVSFNSHNSYHSAYSLTASAAGTQQDVKSAPSQAYSKSSAAQTVGSSPILMSDRLRRKISGELHQIGELLGKSSEQLSKLGLKDRMSTEISEWKKRFSQSLSRNHDTECVLQRYVEELLQLLRDPVCPLDDQSVLGSDGRTYSQMTLTLFRQGTPEQFRNRSPSCPDDPTPFTTRPHEVVRYMLKWLNSYGVQPLANVQIKQHYDQLMAQNRVLASPTISPQRDIPLHPSSQVTSAAAQTVLEIQLKERAQRLQKEREETKKKEQQTPHGSLLAPPPPLLFSQDIQLQQRMQRIAAIRKEREEAQKKKNEEEEELRQKLEKQNAAISSHLSNELSQVIRSSEELLARSSNGIELMNEQHQASVRRLNLLAENLEKELAELNRGNEELDKEIADVGAGIDQARLQDLQLRKEIIEVEKAMKEREKNMIKDLAVAVAIVGICVFATWALAAALPAGGAASGAILPASKGAKFLIMITV